MVGTDTYIIDEWYGDRHVVTEVKLATLDHITPRSKGGDNSSSNLITACMRCNRLRGDSNWIRFAATIMREVGPWVCTTVDKVEGTVTYSRATGLHLRKLTAPIRKRIRTILNTNWGF
jgi:hypothetical protein